MSTYQKIGSTKLLTNKKTKKTNRFFGAVKKTFTKVSIFFGLKIINFKLNNIESKIALLINKTKSNEKKVSGLYDLKEKLLPIIHNLETKIKENPNLNTKQIFYLKNRAEQILNRINYYLSSLPLNNQNRVLKSQKSKNTKNNKTMTVKEIEERIRYITQQSTSRQITIERLTDFENELENINKNLNLKHLVTNDTRRLLHTSTEIKDLIKILITMKNQRLPSLQKSRPGSQFMSRINTTQTAPKPLPKNNTTQTAPTHLPKNNTTQTASKPLPKNNTTQTAPKPLPSLTINNTKTAFQKSKAERLAKLKAAREKQNTKKKSRKETNLKKETSLEKHDREYAEFIEQLNRNKREGIVRDPQFKK